MLSYVTHRSGIGESKNLNVEDQELGQVTGGVTRVLASNSDPAQRVFTAIEVDADVASRLNELEGNLDQLALDRVLVDQGLSGFRIDQLAIGYEDDAGRC